MGGTRMGDVMGIRGAFARISGGHSGAFVGIRGHSRPKGYYGPSRLLEEPSGVVTAMPM